MAAHHMADPKPQHHRRVYRIARYLLGTHNKGMIILPDRSDPKLEFYVDSDFAGNYDSKDHDVDINSELVRSLSAYILLFADVPLVWITKLQGETALSTTEAE